MNLQLLRQKEFIYADRMVEENTTFPRIVPAGDSAALIRFGSELDFDVNASVLEFDHYLAGSSIPGVMETSPALVSLLVRYDPLQVSYTELEQQLQQQLDVKDWLQNPVIKDPAHWKIPVYYGGDTGEDLTEVAHMLGISETDAVDQHSQCLLRVLTIGFAPGVAYLGMLPEQWNVPRLTVIKPKVPAGAILVAVRQTVMAAAAMPTGWRCIGRTPLNNFYPQNSPPVFVKHGDTVQYSPITEREFKALQLQQQNGESVIERVA